MSIPCGVLLSVTLLGACVGAGDGDDDWADPEETSGKADGGGWSASTIPRWARFAAGQVKARAIPPPQAARIFGYVGLAMHEAAQAGRRAPESLAEHLHAIEPMPVPSRARHDVRVAVAVAVTDTLATLIPDARAAIDGELASYLAELGGSRAVVERSRAFGAAVARVLARRVMDDGYEATRGLAYVVPVGPGLWVGNTPGARPLEPYWGRLQPFADAHVVKDCASLAGAPPAYSGEVTSELYAEAFATWEAGVAPERHYDEIAYFWVDAPGQTSTPFGHWIELAAQTAEQEQVGLRTAAKWFAVIGMAGADAFVAGWDIKYRYNLLRPVTYIRRHIDPAWTPRLATPPHPEFVSGHSVGSGAAATVLTAWLGDDYAFVDRTRAGLTVSDASGSPRLLATRAFTSFEAAALEAAESRLAGGIHFPIGNQRGLEVGTCVADRLLEVLDAR